ncbi:glycosyltransferase family 2 protein [Klebsiella variicola]|uniref:glycosyltransferase family 2 protein n=1 Tax=Klebsiella variicola TaxID=244366 RepID=UPI001888A8BF|nr:glycosyltransferase family 2 protein [Klebsiella variicola]
MFNPSIAVVMATYNGEKFINEQIQSILNQTHQHLTLYISDDGSTDNTIEIIKNIALNDSRLQFIGVNEHPGVVRNFNRAFLETHEDIVFLADQDDIWPKDRIKKMINYYIEQAVDTEQPSLLFTDMVLIDKNSEILASSFYKELEIDPNYNKELKYLTWRCTSYGCTMMVNRPLLNQALPLPQDEDVTMHDNWLILCAANLGKVYYMDYGSVFYRQHESNHTGGRRRTLLQKLKSLKAQLKKINTARIKREKQSHVLLQRELAHPEFIKFSSLDNKIDFFKSNILIYKKERRIYSIFYFLSMFCR